MKKSLSISMIVTLIVSLFLVSCASANKNEPITMEEFLKMNTDNWFITGKTSYIIEGKTVSSNTEAYNFFEDTHYVVKPNGEDVLLKGTANELWRSNIDKVKRTYTKVDGSELQNSDFITDEYIQLKTKATPESNFAYFIPKKYTVLVNTSWGDVLTANRDGIEHAEGDYLVSAKNPDGTPNLNDVWVVNGVLFKNTYSPRN